MSDLIPANYMTAIAHDFVGWLLYPVIAALIIMAALAVFEIGTAVGERFGGVKKLRNQGYAEAQSLGRRRVERADMLARIAPMLGLMGTLIPLGPGLAGLGEGNLNALTDAIMIAFDTTVLGLFTGAIGFVLGRLRRRWYDDLMDWMEDNQVAS